MFFKTLKFFVITLLFEYVLVSDDQSTTLEKLFVTSTAR